LTRTSRIDLRLGASMMTPNPNRMLDALAPDTLPNGAAGVASRAGAAPHSASSTSTALRR
jgi:hypothetical protein